MVVDLRNDDGEIDVIFLDTWDNTELNEGICNGVLNTGGTTDEGIGISIGTAVIDSGNIVAF